MKQLLRFCLGLAIVFCLRAEASSKRLEQRAWLGGEFWQASRGDGSISSTQVRAFPLDLKQRGGVLVISVRSETPIAKGGLEAGDLILAVDAKPVTSLKALRRAIDSHGPGDLVRLSVWRNGCAMERPVTLGKETYQRVRTLSLGLILSSNIDPVPDPSFSLAALGYKESCERMELRSPGAEFVLRHRDATSSVIGVQSPESWSAWCVLFGFGGHKRIVSQESAAAEKGHEPVR